MGHVGFEACNEEYFLGYILSVIDLYFSKLYLTLFFG